MKFNTAQPALSRFDNRDKALFFLTAPLALALAVLIALSVGETATTIIVLAAAAGAGLICGALALTRFFAYAIGMLILGSSLDLAKLGAATGGVGAAEAPKALDPSSILGALFVLMAMLWLASQHRSMGTFPGSPLRRALLVFLAACSLSILGSSNPGTAALVTIRILSAVMIFMVFEQLMLDPDRMRRALLAVYLSAVFPIVFTVFGLLSGNPRTEQKGDFTRIVGTFNQSNSFGRYLMLLIVMGVALYPYVERRFRVPLMAILVGCSGCLAMTYTRSALVGTVIGLVVVGLVQNRRVVVGLLVAGALALLVVPNLSARFTELAGEDEGSNTLEWRLGYWAEVLPLANVNPVTGIGMGQTQYYTEEEKAPHNDLLRAYVETGLIGLAAYSYLMVLLIVTGRRAVAVTDGGTFDRGVAVGYLGCAVSFLADSMVANVLSNVAVLWYFFTFTAATSAIVRRLATTAEVAEGGTRTSSQALRADRGANTPRASR